MHTPQFSQEVPYGSWGLPRKKAFLSAMWAGRADNSCSHATTTPLNVMTNKLTMASACMIRSIPNCKQILTFLLPSLYLSRNSLTVYIFIKFLLLDCGKQAEKNGIHFFFKKIRNISPEPIFFEEAPDQKLIWDPACRAKIGWEKTDSSKHPI